MTLTSLRAASMLVVLAVICAAPGCGLKGPLYLPENPSQSTEAEAGREDAASTTQKKDRTSEARKGEAAPSPPAQPADPPADSATTPPDR
jgi:predicted small lipoprotein YifL